MGITYDSKKRVLVFCSFKSDGSELRELFEQSQVSSPNLDATIVGVICNHARGKVYDTVQALGMQFEYWGNGSPEKYQELMEEFSADYVISLNWPELIVGVDPAYVVETTWKMENGQCFVKMCFEDGTMFFERPVYIRPDDTSEILCKRVNEFKRAWQSTILNLVVHRKIWLKNGQVEYSSQDIKELCIGREKNKPANFHNS